MTDNVIVHDVNVDKALTSRPDPDDWDDPGERSEDTGTAGKLTWGPGADEHYGAAHAAAAALREQRRLNRGAESGMSNRAIAEVVGVAHTTVNEDRKATGSNLPVADRKVERPEQYLICDHCWSRVNGLHRCTGPIRLVDANDRGSDYYERLELRIKSMKGRNAVVVDVDIWREPPGYAGHYLLHSRSRELWSAPRTIIASNGTPRTFQGKKMTAHNGSYSLTINGVTRSRGINALYRETFPEFFSKKKRRRKVGEWDDTVRPRVSEFEWAGNEGLAEWLAGGAARVVTRPE